VAACRAPQRPAWEAPLHGLAPGRLVERLRGYGGMPPEVLAQHNLVQVMLPTIRDDLEIAETYQAGPAAALSCPVTALGGLADQQVTVEDLAGWRQVTRGSFGASLMAGDHFFISRAESLVIPVVAELLGAHLAASSASRPLSRSS
jgi:medium-chain acyl-[acyl-carrier-protein] hydrolase